MHSLKKKKKKDKSMGEKKKKNKGLLNLPTQSSAPAKHCNSIGGKQSIYFSFSPNHPLLTTERQSVGLKGPLVCPSKAVAIQADASVLAEAGFNVS